MKLLIFTYPFSGFYTPQNTAPRELCACFFTGGKLLLPSNLGLAVRPALVPAVLSPKAIEQEALDSSEYGQLQLSLRSVVP